MSAPVLCTRTFADRGQSSDRPPILLFVHLPRTAGTTMVTVLRREYGPTALLKVTRGFGIFDGEIVVGQNPLDDVPPERRSQVRAICGHMSVGLHQLIDAPTRYLTILRSPVERLVSLYAYIRRTPQHPWHERLVQEHWTLRDCLTNPLPQFNNGQLRMLTGAIDTEALGHGVHDDELLQRALRVLDEQFDVVGTTRGFDDFLVLASLRYRWQVPTYRRRNVSTAPTPPSSLDAETRALAEQMNEMDRVLYAYAERRLARQVQAAGPAFQLRAGMLRMFNATGSSAWNLDGR